MIICYIQDKQNRCSNIEVTEVILVPVAILTIILDIVLKPKFCLKIIKQEDKYKEKGSPTLNQCKITAQHLWQW